VFRRLGKAIAVTVSNRSYVLLKKLQSLIELNYLSGELFNNSEYKLVNFVTVVAICTVTTVTTVTVDTGVIRTAMFSMVIMVILLFR